MRITILAVGTRGDVQPFIALGLGLQSAGHKVQLASNPIFKDFVKTRGLDFAPVGDNPQEWVKQFNEQTSRKKSALAKKAILWRIVGSTVEQMMTDAFHCSQDTQAIIYSTLALPGYHIAEKLGVPCYAAYKNPITPTRAFPHPLHTSTFNLGGLNNRLTYVFEEQFRWQLTRKIINRCREEILKLPAVPITGLYSQQQKQQLPLLHCFSPSVIPKPDDWLSRAYVTGYWFLDRPSDWQPPKELVDFIAAGSPPISIGFGSMSDLEAKALTQLVLNALTQTGQRGILLTGWGGLSNIDLPDNVFKIDSVPHDWLFPQMAAVVHHGGVGTTAAVLRAGVPSIIVPFAVDQPFWGRRVASLGVGTSQIPRKDLTAEKLVAAIRTATGDEDMKDRARVLGEKIRSEDGVARAVEIFHRHLPNY
ncbi:MAG: glycosyltransferase [Hormoscilla sp.]